MASANLKEYHKNHKNQKYRNIQKSIERKSFLSVFFDDSTEDHSLWPYKIANDASPIDILAQ